jgi:drug/metabolite transporter (DMT)-like permease
VAFNQFLFVLGLSRTSVGHAAIFANMSPMLVVLLAGASGLEKFSRWKLVGVTVSLAGVVLLRVMDAHPHGEATFWGDFLTFLGSAAFSIFTVIGKPSAKRYGSVAVNTVAYVGGAVMLAPVTIWEAAHFPLATAPWSAWASVFYMAAGSSVICYLIYYYALGRMQASQLAATNYALPVLATLLGVWMLGESISGWFVASALIIFGGIYLVERVK